ncbi:hypothetical protein HYALB_00006889 [Hymenoscyphus albidus]|uniref:Uncharacterized protein n=1 Tax=Hymenoscyphus albidus TaxID=595503 RepID=A0A9N9M238_9HELO|nr:hypothetical protein HYALB_00006889 [Hymenoscyphus albidus]
MAPTHLDIDLAKTYTHADMLLSARKSPRLNLRRTASSNNNMEKAPLSSTSSRFNFNHLIASPPPSPSLPALVPRHGKPLPARTPRTYLRAALWLSGVLVILYFASGVVHKDRHLKAVGWAANSGEQYEMVEETELPDFPTPVVVTDKRGRAKWTVSIPPDSEFPLEPRVYADICMQNMEVATHVADLHSHIYKEHAAHYGYYHVDPNFMDVAEAEEHGLLPGLKAKTNMNDAPLVGENNHDGLIESDVCKKTLTFVLETRDAGLGNTLLMLWTAYGLAKKEGREFFVDDSRWAYGKYTKFFMQPPIPQCRPPPRHEMLPCPRHARHLLVSGATASYVFGGAFNDQFEDAKKMEVNRLQPIFQLARQGYESLFHLGNEDEPYLMNRVADIRAKTVVGTGENLNGIVIGVHVRHGDRRPFEFQYKDSYVPLDRYSDRAHDLIHATFNNSDYDVAQNTDAEAQSLILVASDDPDVYTSEEFSSAMPAQEVIRLAAKEHIKTGDQPAGKTGMRNFIDSPVGWEGGFFAPMFWSLGKPNSVPATAAETPDIKLPPTSEALRLRELVGRAYLLDLAVLGQSTDAIVCTVSSMGCRLLAVMMGWEKSIERKGFVNIDGDFQWRGIPW